MDHSSTPPGFYTVRCVLARSTSGIPFTRDTTFCILPKDDINAGDRRFGWSFADRDQGIPLAQLPNFLQLSSIRGAKIPIWIDSNDEKASEEQSWLIEKLKAQDIDIVGVLDMPPKTEQRFFANADDLTFDSVWEQENVWRTLIDPIVSRISLQLSSIQVGRDRDFSFVGNERLQPKIASLQKLIELYGPSSQLIIPWSALHPPLAKSEPSSKVYQYSIDPPWTAAELQSFVKHASQSDQKFWINLEGLTPITLDRENGSRKTQKYSIENCLHHLTESMVAFVKSGASKAWVGSAMDPDQSWLQNGQPGLMLLPFRTLSQALAEKEYVGRLDFPNKSICHVLQNGPDGVMILSNPRETTEQLYIGEQPIATDLFGREVPLVVSNSGFGTERKFPVGPRPIIIRGINVDVAKWSMGLEVEDPIIETTTSGKQSLHVAFSNPTKSALRGTIRITAPEILQGDPMGTEFKVDAMGKQNVDVGLTLLPDATSQSAQLRIDIEIQSTKVYRFSVYRKVRVGQDDLELLVHQRIDDSNNLILQLEFLNRTGRTLSLDCQIVPPSRPRMRREILDFNERTERTIVLNNASELIGKTINFRAQEFGSDRVVNQRIVVSPP